MKKLWIAGVFSACLGLSACSEYDEAYYLKNIDSAIKKEADCKSALEEAVINRNEQKYQELKANKECQAAHSAVRKHKEEQREKERLAKEAERQVKIEEAKQKLNQQYASLDWQKAATAFANSECAKKWFGFSDDDVECLAFKAIYDEKAQQAQKEMLAQNDFEQIQGLEKEYCKVDKRKYSACSIWGEAAKQKAVAYFEALPLAELFKLKKQYESWNSKVNNNISSAWEEVKAAKHKVAIEQYVQDTEALKRDYNQCIDILQPLEKANKWEQISEVKYGYPCSQVQEARSKLGLEYGFKEKM